MIINFYDTVRIISILFKFKKSEDDEEVEDEEEKETDNYEDLKV